MMLLKLVSAVSNTEEGARTINEIQELAKLPKSKKKENMDAYNNHCFPPFQLII